MSKVEEQTIDEKIIVLKNEIIAIKDVYIDTLEEVIVAKDKIIKALVCQK